MDEKNKMISFVIVTWNSENYIYNCLSSIFKLNYSYKEVIVVDNGSNDKTVDIIRANFPDTKLIILVQNPGFGFSCNKGAEISNGNFIFFLNPDTEIVKCDLELVLDIFLKDNSIAVLGSKLLWDNGKFQDSYKRFFSPFFSVLEVFEFNYYFKNNWWNKKVNYNFNVFNKLTEVDFVIGAAFVVKKDFFDKVNGFDENFFMYFEEIDLCKRIKKIGGKIYFNPQIEVIHYKGKSSQQTNVRKLDYYESMVYYHKKHYGFLGFIVVRFSIIFSCILFFIVYLIKFIFRIDNQVPVKFKIKLKLFIWALGL
ncbi:MAG: glycosyltransferase family 2 protein [Candidatus Goldbacteria bacterium]|nr:glycosyltransferase family 2 protein [Candidatus Goldiibacteriota bacterium]